MILEGCYDLIDLILEIQGLAMQCMTHCKGRGICFFSFFFKFFGGVKFGDWVFLSNMEVIIQDRIIVLCGSSVVQSQVFKDVPSLSID